jgi:hypothetical protein
VPTLDELVDEFERGARALDVAIQLARTQGDWHESVNLTALQVGVLDAIRGYRAGLGLSNRDEEEA